MSSVTAPPNNAIVTEDHLRSRPAVQNNLLISGRYLLANSEEYPGKFRYVTIEKGQLIAPIASDPGEIIACYLDRVGIITGVIDSIASGGISVVFDISPFRHPRILARLEWHAARKLEHIEMRSGPLMASQDQRLSSTNTGFL
jgi:hypothetical protein